MLGLEIRKSLLTLIEQFQLSGVDRKKSDFQRIMRSALRKERKHSLPFHELDPGSVDESENILYDVAKEIVETFFLEERKELVT